LGFGLVLGVGDGGALVPRMADSSDGGVRVLEKPSRSEEQLDLSAEEQENRTEAVHQKLEALLPKRPLKPARSEAQQLAAAVQESETPPSLHSPEFLRFQGLQDSASVKLPVDGSSVIVVEEEYVETKYYNDFAASEEKLHHTTGTGFIPLDPPETPPFHLSSEDQQESAAGEAAAIHQKTRGGIQPPMSGGQILKQLLFLLSLLPNLHEVSLCEVFSKSLLFCCPRVCNQMPQLPLVLLVRHIKHLGI
jgi:hypothetical protein